MNVFKLFSGEQDGSEITLKTNEDVIVGNEITCDIYLATSAQTATAFTINLPDEEHINFKFETNLKLMAVDNTPILSEVTYDLPLFFNFESINIAIGEPKQILEWPKIQLSDEENLDNQLNPGDLDGAIHDLEEGLQAEKPLSKLHQIIRTIQTKLEPFENYVNQKYSWASKVIYASIGTLLIIIILTLVSVFTSIYQENKLQQRLLLEAELKKSFNELPSNAMSLSLIKARDKQMFVVQGLVYSNKESTLVHEKLARFQEILSYSLLTAPQAIAKIKAILAAHSMNNLHILYESATQSITINGVVPYGISAINDTEIDINNQLASLGDFNFNVYDASQVKNDFEHSLGKLDNLLDITDNLTTSSNLSVSGYLTTKQLADYNNIVSQFENKYLNIITINSNIQDAISALPFKIYGIFVGNPSYVITDQGNTVFVGGRVGNFRLTSVTDSKITLTNNDGYNLEIQLSQIGNQPIIATNEQKRTDLLSEELAKNKQILQEEQQQLLELKKYRAQAKDESSIHFSEQQIKTIGEDIQAKEKDIHTLQGILHAQ